MLNSLSEGMTTLTGIIKPEMTVYVPVGSDTNIIKNLIDGEGVGSVQQNLSEDGKKKGSTAHGKYSAAFNKDNHAYQRSSFAVGGGNQVGMTEEEFNAKYPEGKDSVGSTYEESNSFGFVAGQQNKVHARGAAIPGGYLNVVDGDYSVVLTGDRNTVSARYASILGGASNNVEVSSDSSTILSGIYNIVGGAYCTVGGIFNVIRSSGTVALGNNLQSDGNHGNKKVLLGSFNNPNSLAFFQLGFGTEDDRKNLVEGFEDGVLLYTVTADGLNPYQVANMGAVKEYADKTYASKEYADKTYASKEYVKDTVTEALENVNISGGGNSSGGQLYRHRINLNVANTIIEDGVTTPIENFADLLFEIINSNPSSLTIDDIVKENIYTMGDAYINDNSTVETVGVLQFSKSSGYPDMNISGVGHDTSEGLPMTVFRTVYLTDYETDGYRVETAVDYLQDDVIPLGGSSGSSLYRHTFTLYLYYWHTDDYVQDISLKFELISSNPQLISLEELREIGYSGIANAYDVFVTGTFTDDGGDMYGYGPVILSVSTDDIGVVGILAQDPCSMVDSVPNLNLSVWTGEQYYDDWTIELTDDVTEL